MKASPDLDNLLARGYVRLMSNPGLLSFAHKLARNLQKPLAMIPFSPFSKGRSKLTKLPLPLLSQWTNSRDLPKFPPRTFHEVWTQELSKKPGDEA